jgi:hypothetical protein
MRELILMNPRRKGKKRSGGGRRRSARNAKGQFTKRRKSGGKRRKSSTLKPMAKRRRSKTKIVRVYRKRSRLTKSGARGSKFVIRGRRMTVRRNPMTSDIIGSFKSILSKDNLHIAGGVIASSFLNKTIGNMLGSKLPMYSSPIGKTVYTIAIPVLAAVALRRFAPKFAEGVALGGLITAVNQLVGQFAPTYAGTFQSYIDSGDMSSMSLTPTTGSIDSARGTSSAVNSYSGIYDSPTPFTTDAWN